MNLQIGAIILLLAMGMRILYWKHPQKHLIKILAVLTIITLGLLSLGRVHRVVRTLDRHEPINRRLGAFFISLAVGMMAYLWIMN